MKLPRLLLLFLFISWYPGIAQQINSKVDLFTVSNGLSENNITALFPDSRGFLWVATENGLNRFDGRSFKQYKKIGEEGLTDYNIKCITEDADGNMWIGTEFGLNKLDPYTEKITRYFEGTGPGSIPYKWCNSLYTDKEKNLWLGTEKGIALYNKQTNSFTNYPISVNGADKKINKYIDKILEDSKGRFWLATSYGVKLFDRNTKTYQSFHHDVNAGIYENSIYSLGEDMDGNIWAGSYGTDLLKFDPQKNSFEKIRYNSREFTSGTITDIKKISLQGKEVLVALTSGGIFMIERSANGDHELRKLPVLEGENLIAALQINPGTLWVGSHKGLVKIKTGNPAFEWISSSVDKASAIFRIVPDIQNPDLFYLTQLSGWNRFELSKRSITSFPLPGAASKVLTSIGRWWNDGTGYWITSLNGFGYYDIYKNRFENLTSIVEDRSGQVSTGFVANDRFNNLWVTLRRSGLLVYNTSTQESAVLFGDTTKQDNVFGFGINDLKKGNDDHIYFTANNKVYRIDPADRSYKIYSPRPEKDPISTDKLSPRQFLFCGKKIFVASNLRIYELKNEQLIPVYPIKGYSSFSIDMMRGNTKGEVWLTTSEGLFKTDTSFSKLVNMSGIVENSSDIRDLYITENGKVLFAEQGRIGILNEQLIESSDRPVSPVISRIKYGNNEKYLVSQAISKIKSPFKEAIEIELSYPGFLDNSQSKLYYRLEGWDKEWKELIMSSSVRYEQLPPGDYTFKTKTINAEEKESEVVGLPFRVIPPFYRTAWFIGLMILVVAAIIMIIYRIRLRKVIEMERLRTRIATDLHDDIGATLSSISMYSEAVRNQVKDKMPHLEPVLNKMGENSRDMVTSMSDIVWAINPNNDDGEKLVNRMESYAKDICAVNNVQFDLTCSEKINDIRFSLEQRKNIYLIFKEALNNALKYSHANHIGLVVDKNGNQLTLSIKDDGKGFDMMNLKPGNGLKNMRLRAEEINAEFEISSIMPGGTHVQLTCDL